jgi:hypothetical protein
LNFGLDLCGDEEMRHRVRLANGFMLLLQTLLGVFLVVDTVRGSPAEPRAAPAERFDDVSRESAGGGRGMRHQCLSRGVLSVARPFLWSRPGARSRA